MIGAMTKGSDAQGLVQYLLQQRDHKHELRERVEVIGGTIIGADVAEISAQYSAWLKTKPGIATPIIHNSLSFPEGEKVSIERQREIGEQWARRMGYDAYTIISHGDDHFHVVAARNTADGKLVSTWQDWKKSERIIRDLEIKHDLERVRASHLLDQSREVEHKKAWTMSQIEQFERTGAVPPSKLVSQAIDEILKDGPVEAPDLVLKLAEYGITAKANIASTGRMNGLSYEIDGVKVTAKAMGRGYTWSNLQQKGMQYEQERHAERLRQISVGGPSRADAPDRVVGGDGPADRGISRELAGEDRGQRVGIDPDGRSDGAADRGQRHRDQASQRVSDEARREDRGAGRHARREPEGRDQSAERRDREAEQGRRQGVGSFMDDRPGLDLRRQRRPRAFDSVERLSAYAGIGSDSPSDRTTAVVRATLDALPTGRYELGLLDRAKNQMRRIPDAVRDRIEKSIGWLKRQNALGREVLFRPQDTRYVLLDDLKPESIERMRRDGMRPAMVAETSKGNMQAWVRLPFAVRTEDRTEAARRLAAEYGGDLGSVAYDKLGKMPGFTNRKPKHVFERDGRELAPYVRLIEASGAVAEHGEDLAVAIRRDREEQARQVEAERQATAQRWQDIRSQFGDDRDHGRFATSWNRQQAEGLKSAKGDQSRADFRAARFALGMGYDPEMIADALRQSPHVAGRDRAGVEDYVNRTLENAGKSVIEARRRQQENYAEIERRQRQERRHGHGHGPSLGG